MQFEDIETQSVTEGLITFNIFMLGGVDDNLPDKQLQQQLWSLSTASGFLRIKQHSESHSGGGSSSYHGGGSSNSDSSDRCTEELFRIIPFPPPLKNNGRIFKPSYFQLLGF